MYDASTLATVGWDAAQTDFPEGLPIRITATGVAINLDPEPFDEDRFRAALREQIDKSKAMADAKGEPWTNRLVLAIDRDAKMAVVDRAVRVAIAEKLDQAVLVLASANRRTPAAVHPALYEAQRTALEKVPPTERAMHVARTLETLVAQCEPARDVFKAIAMVSPTERCPTMTNGLADAFVKCGCPAVEAEIMTSVQVLGGPVDTPILLAHPVRLVADPAIGPRPETWAQFVAEHREPIAELRVPPAG